MRDAFVTRGPDREFQMVWTWDWKGQSIGYAHSKDLIHWSPQTELPLMAGIPGTDHTWAPEIYWDSPKSQWIIIWSSTVAGRQAGNRIYSSFTSDFKTFSKPTLFFDPGYDVIDATILQARGQYYLFFKDERTDPLKKQIKLAAGRTIEGPWSEISDPFTETWSEGPSALQVGNMYVVYYDHYRQPQRYSAVGTNDLLHWFSLADRVSFPEGARHGSFLRITEEELRKLKS
jgi:beta-xylosidase